MERRRCQVPRAAAGFQTTIEAHRGNFESDPRLRSREKSVRANTLARVAAERRKNLSPLRGSSGANLCAPRPSAVATFLGRSAAKILYVSEPRRNHVQNACLNNSFDRDDFGNDGECARSARDRRGEP